eukprot:scaffold4037_cov145-Skeletonema_marinoi.AAC.8
MEQRSSSAKARMHQSAQNGGVCFKHGAKAKLYRSDGCTKNALEGGVCFKHDAKVKCKKFSSEGVPVMLKTERKRANDSKLFVSITLLRFLDR